MAMGTAGSSLPSTSPSVPVNTWPSSAKTAPANQRCCGSLPGLNPRTRARPRTTAASATWPRPPACRRRSPWATPSTTHSNRSAPSRPNWTAWNPAWPMLTRNSWNATATCRPSTSCGKATPPSPGWRRHWTAWASAGWTGSGRWVRSPAGSSTAWPWPACWLILRTSSCWTSPPTIWTPAARPGSRRGWPPTGGPSSWFPTTARCCARWPPPSSRWTPSGARSTATGTATTGICGRRPPSGNAGCSSTAAGWTRWLPSAFRRTPWPGKWATPAAATATKWASTSRPAPGSRPPPARSATPRSGCAGSKPIPLTGRRFP